MTNTILTLTRDALRKELFAFWAGRPSEVTAATEREVMTQVAKLDGEIAYRDLKDTRPTVAPQPE
jgi:hypothetical protein